MAFSSTPALASSPSIVPDLRRDPKLPRRLALALIVSLAAHFALGWWPIDFSAPPDEEPLRVTITELPPPPLPLPRPAPVLHRSKPKAPTATLRSDASVVSVPLLETMPEPDSPAPEAVPTLEDTTPPSPPPTVASAATPPAPVAQSPDEVPGTPTAPQKELPPRLDLAYKVFLGTQGFMIGDATYRFEHSGNRYQITTVAQARGLAALIIHGQGRIESRGLITSTGLRPEEFAIERGSADRREVASFDWKAGLVTLYEQKTAPLEPATYDPLAVLWQYYFSPPSGDQLSFSLATTRRVQRYTIHHEGNEKINWAQGEIDTELWHRSSDDGKIESYLWLAPSLHYVPIKLRVVATHLGTLEALLDSIRVDEPLAAR